MQSGMDRNKNIFTHNLKQNKMPLLPAIASAVGGQIMGMWNDNRQYQLNKKNMALQVQAQKELTDYNKNKQMEMWKETGPVGMAEQLGLAGMSKALMYGGSGAGGQTASVNTGSVGQGGGQASDQIQNAMGLALMKAQKENIEADTQNKLADAEDKKGSAGNRPTIS